MTAHVVFTAIDPGRAGHNFGRNSARSDSRFYRVPGPADERRRLDGRLSGSIAERSRAAIAAGCDVVLHCNGEMAEMREVAASVPVLAGEAARRAAAALAARRPAKPIDMAASRAEFSRLVAGVWQPAEGTA